MTHTTYLTIVADHVHAFMETEFSDGSVLFYQDNASCHKAKMVQECFEEHNNEFKEKTWSPNLNPITFSVETGQTEVLLAAVHCHRVRAAKLWQMITSHLSHLLFDTWALIVWRPLRTTRASYDRAAAQAKKNQESLFGAEQIV